MKLALSDTQLLSPQQIGELASQLERLHPCVLKAVQCLNKDIAIKKTDIVSPWKSAPVVGDPRRAE